MNLRAVIFSRTLLAACLLAGGFFVGSAAASANGVATDLRHLLEHAEAVPVLSAAGEPLYATRTLRKFYVQRVFRAAWVRDGRLLPAAHEFVDWLSRLEGHGIDPGGYHLVELRKRVGAGARATAAELADTDLLLTDAWLLIASHLYAGRINPETIDPEWFSNRRDRDFADLLNKALDSGEAVQVLDTLHPEHSGYASMVKALERYRAIAVAGGWPTVAATGKLEPGSHGPAVAALRERLRVSGELAADAAAEDPEMFDAALVDAVRVFQASHGLDVDGVVGRQTLATLNVSAADRARQLRINLERWRWLPQNLGARHLVVNIAGFYLDLVEDEVSRLRMDVIVGRPARKTPVFSGAMTYMVFNPAWDVPHKLAVQDKLPVLQKDPAYLSRENFVVFPRGGTPRDPLDASRIEWNRLAPDAFPYRLRQLPGPNNALGRVKFMFPNRFNVYLHDTPARELFKQGRRAFSSGCIRLSKPLELARLLLDVDPKTAGTDIDALLAGGRETVVRLAGPLPVHLLYWTAWVDAGGNVHFRDDLYGRDARVWNAIERDPERRAS